VKRKVGEGGGGGDGGDLDPSDLVDKKRRKEKLTGKTKRKGNESENGLRNRDQTISGLDLPHPEVRAGRAALSTEEKGLGSEGWVSLEGSSVCGDKKLVSYFPFVFNTITHPHLYVNTIAHPHLYVEPPLIISPPPFKQELIQ
jgi:hypothetical protein